MKKYIVGARNNPHHTFSVFCNTNFLFIAKIASAYGKLFANEVEISETQAVILRKRKPPFDDEYLHKTDAQEHYYIWRGWWQRVGKLIYDMWDGETYSTYFPLDDDEEQNYYSIFYHEEL